MEMPLIRNVRHNGQWWEAEVDGVAVDRRFGSWQIDSKPRRDCLPHVAAALQAHLPADERKPRNVAR